jgi:hypothetical protein
MMPGTDSEDASEEAGVGETEAEGEARKKPCRQGGRMGRLREGPEAPLVSNSTPKAKVPKKFLSRY